MEGLGEQERGALIEALDDEYKAWTTYDQVIGDFGEVRPFINIRAAERRHIDALLSLFKRYGLAPPPNRWLGKAPRYSDVAAACRAGVTGEIENVGLYDRLLQSTSRPDILSVLNALREASQERHLPTFQRCAQRQNRSGPV